VNKIKNILFSWLNDLLISVESEEDLVIILHFFPLYLRCYKIIIFFYVIIVNNFILIIKIQIFHSFVIN
jgi:hypothetical protein